MNFTSFLRTGFVVFILLFMTFVSACSFEVETSYGLNFDDALLARMNEEGVLMPTEKAEFQRGENVHLVLLNVGKFKKGEDGKHWFDMNVQVVGPNDQIVLEQEDLLGENGHIVLPDDMAASPYGLFNTSDQLDVGGYTMEVTIIDKVSGGTANAKKSFELK